MSAKFIFITGGVVSGLGKGITAASLGRLLKDRGFGVKAEKLDPYMNVDPGTMSPYQHGEVFVTEDGAETDLDLGHYERFIDVDLDQNSNLTSGRVYWNVLHREREGGYLGQTVQVIPHITDEIKSFLYKAQKKPGVDLVLTEIGGTTGDIESQPFLEAARQLRSEMGRENCLFIHVTLVPYLASSSELKSKPTQHSVRELQSFGIFPDIIVLRSPERITESIRRKVSLFCNVDQSAVIENRNVENLYEVPVMLEEAGLPEAVLRGLRLKAPHPLSMRDWDACLARIRNAEGKVKIALVGKYVALHDSYLSIVEALKCGAWENGAHLEIDWVDSGTLSVENVLERLENVDGILIPGGFGERGIEGMVLAAGAAEKMGIPIFGICLGMQVLAIWFARSQLGLQDADSGEFSPNSRNKVIDLMPEQQKVHLKGGTMRLGAYPCRVKDGTILHSAYQTDLVFERHRHRYEFNNAFRAAFEAQGAVFSGLSPDGDLVEAMELPGERFSVGVQFHPEFKSRPTRAHPLFRAFLKAALQKRRSGH